MMYERHYQNRTVRWCKYSSEALDRLNPQKPYRFGRLLRMANRRPTSWSNGHPYAVVKWNGCKSESHYHADFIEVFAETPIGVLEIPSLPVFPHLLRSFVWRAA